MIRITRFRNLCVAAAYFWVVCLTLNAGSAFAQNTLTYQGEILNAARAPITASYPMVFALYTDRDGGVALWTEAYESVDVLDGSFTVNLGSVTPFPQHLRADASLYLAVAVNGAQRPPTSKGLRNFVRIVYMPKMCGMRTFILER